MAHEYSHVLHFDRMPEEPMTLGRELVTEGMAVYLTNQILKNIEPSNSVPFMENEDLIKDSIKLELNDTSMQIFMRYVSDGSFAKPPKGFVEKTAYFAGYRIIEECIGKGMDVEGICELKSDEIIEKSGYFN